MTLSPSPPKAASRSKPRTGPIKLGNVALDKGPRTAGVIVDGRAQSAARKAVSAGADILEVRADTFADTSPEKLKKILTELKGLGRPLLLTVRSAKEGGKKALGNRQRELLYTTLMPFVDAVDVELSSSAILENVIKSARGHKKTVVISYHNFKSTPGEKRLREIITRARAKGADIVKIAARANRADDLKRLGSLLAGQGDLIIIAMGETGRASRVFFPMLGSLLTYGSITSSTAPGQMSLREIKREFLRYGFGK